MLSKLPQISMQIEVTEQQPVYVNQCITQPLVNFDAERDAD